MHVDDVAFAPAPKPDALLVWLVTTVFLLVAALCAALTAHAVAP